MSGDNILLDIDERIATITLNRPDALNATTDELYSELSAVIRSIAANRDVGCVILTGAGRGFCAGADLKARKDDMTPLARRDRHRWILRDVLLPLFQLEKPVIAAVNGPAAGAGFNLALACDFIIASEQASFIQAFAKVALVPDLGGLWLLARVVGQHMSDRTGQPVIVENKPGANGMLGSYFTGVATLVFSGFGLETIGTTVSFSFFVFDGGVILAAIGFALFDD